MQVQWKYWLTSQIKKAQTQNKNKNNNENKRNNCLTGNPCFSEHKSPWKSTTEHGCINTAKRSCHLSLRKLSFYLSSTLSRRKCFKKTLTIPIFSYSQFSARPEPQKMGACETASRVHGQTMWTWSLSKSPGNKQFCLAPKNLKIYEKKVSKIREYTWEKNKKKSNITLGISELLSSYLGICLLMLEAKVKELFNPMQGEIHIPALLQPFLCFWDWVTTHSWQFHGHHCSGFHSVWWSSGAKWLPDLVLH